MNASKIVAILILIVAGLMPARAAGPIDWQDWTPGLFDRSRAEKKLVLLDLKAVWCHWCHVMDATTYRDAEVAKLLGEHFVAVKVDQDANPDLSNRYGDWGWPATILFAPDGTEIAKLRGYRSPEQMRAILKAFIAEPTPGPSVEDQAEVVPSPSHFLTVEQRKRLRDNWLAAYDRQNGGWGAPQKFIHAGSMDYALMLAEAGDAGAAAMARETLDNALALIDPEWGGIYQYSDKPDWSSPHYEKIMQFQANALRQYAFAARLFGDARYERAAASLSRYLTEHLRAPEGGFYATQDADLNADVDGHEYYALKAAERLKLGVPRVDKNVYARENGWAIAALAAHADATGDIASLNAAIRAAQWIKQNRALSGGGFSHGDADRAGPYLGDTLAMGQAFLALYAATGDVAWARDAMNAAGFIGAAFKADAGFITAKSGEASSGPLAKPIVQVDETIELARFFNQLFRYTGETRFQADAEHAMRYLASEQVTGSQRFLAGLLVADNEISIEPVHMTIIGRRADPALLALHAAARGYPALYKRIDVWDPREGPPLNPDVQYPELDRAAAFACSNQICSRPVFDPNALGDVVRQMAALRVSRTD